MWFLVYVVLSTFLENASSDAMLHGYLSFFESVVGWGNSV